MKKILKIFFLILVCGIVFFVGLSLYDNFISSRAKNEDVEFCKCLKEYKASLTCGRYGFSSTKSVMNYYTENNELFLMGSKNPSVTAKKKYEEMKLQWDLCQKRVKNCFMCNDKQ